MANVLAKEATGKRLPGDVSNRTTRDQCRLLAMPVERILETGMLLETILNEPVEPAAEDQKPPGKHLDPQ